MISTGFENMRYMASIGGASNASPAKPVDPDVQKAAKGFEAFFLRQMMEDMRSASLGDDIFGSSATQNFQEMADAQLAENLSDTGAFGIAKMLEKQFSRSVADNSSASGDL